MTRWSALLLFAFVLAMGCGKAEKPTAAKKSKPKSTKKEKPTNLRKGPPQNVFGPYLLEEHIKNLSNSDAQKRRYACVQLGFMGEHAKEAIPKLKKLAASDKDASVKKEARKAISAISKAGKTSSTARR
jgi:hypothetical protein